VLLALDPATRIRLALQQVQAALDAVGDGGGAPQQQQQQQQGVVPGGRGSRGGSAVAPGSSTNGPTTNSSNSGQQQKQQQQQQRDRPISGGLNPAGRRPLPPGFWGVGPSPGPGGSAGEEDEEAEDEVGVLLARLAAAKPPGEVLKAAMREAKRLKSGGDHQPGAAAARAYLELLADLPWNTLAWQLQGGGGLPAAAGGPAAAKGSEHGGSVDTAPQQQQHHHQQQEVRGPPPPMPLSAARRLLDAQHTGLAKVKERVVEHIAVSRLLGPVGRGQGRAPVLCLIGECVWGGGEGREQQLYLYVERSEGQS
jgi:hypothetical protein